MAKRHWNVPLAYPFPTGKSPFGFVLMPTETEALWMVGHWALSLIPKAWDQYFLRCRGILRGARVVPSGQ